MDEAGYLRVATPGSASAWTPRGSWSTQNDNRVYILDTAGATLDEVGRLTGLAPGKQLYAARFIGNKGVPGAFLQTDPLSSPST